MNRDLNKRVKKIANDHQRSINAYRGSINRYSHECQGTKLAWWIARQSGAMIRHIKNPASVHTTK